MGEMRNTEFIYYSTTSTMHFAFPVSTRYVIEPRLVGSRFCRITCQYKNSVNQLAKECKLRDENGFQSDLVVALEIECSLEQ